MIPASRPARAPADEPALVLYCGRRALILHPGGPDHENVVTTRARLERHGVVCITVPDDPTPFLEAAPTALRARALVLLAGRSDVPFSGTSVPRWTMNDAR